MKVVAVVSGKGGVGKSFVTCNTGVILSLAGYTTLVVDADVNLANVELMYGIETNATLQDLVDGVASPEDTIHEGPGGVKVVPAGVKLRRRIRASEFDMAVSKVVEAVDADFVLIDAPAGLDAQVTTCVQMSDEYLLVAVPEVTSLVDAYKVKGVADAVSRQLGVVLNRVGKIMFSKGRVESLLGPIIAAVPEDTKVGDSVDSGIPYVLRYNSGIAVNELFKVASKVAGVEIRPRKKRRFPLLGKK